MEYSEYHEKELAIRQKMNELQEKYQTEMMVAKQELSGLTNQYLGDFAVGKAVKYWGRKYFVEYISWIADNETTVRIRKATKDGSRPNPNGKLICSVEISDLEVWNEL